MRERLTSAPHSRPTLTPRERPMPREKPTYIRSTPAEVSRRAGVEEAPNEYTYMIELEVSLFFCIQTLSTERVTMTARNARRYRKGMREAVPADSMAVTELINTMDRLDRLENRDSLEPMVRIVSLKRWGADTAP